MDDDIFTPAAEQFSAPSYTTAAEYAADQCASAESERIYEALSGLADYINQEIQ